MQGIFFVPAVAKYYWIIGMSGTKFVKADAGVIVAFALRYRGRIWLAVVIKAAFIIQPSKAWIASPGQSVVGQLLARSQITQNYLSPFIAVLGQGTGQVMAMGRHRPGLQYKCIA